MSGRPSVNPLLEADYVTRLYGFILERGATGIARGRRLTAYEKAIRAGVLFILNHLDEPDVETALERIEHEFPDAVARYQANEGSA